MQKMQQKRFSQHSRYINTLNLSVKKGNGSTTVAATMIIANLAGIKIFVTGGIGLIKILNIRRCSQRS